MAKALITGFHRIVHRMRPMSLGSRLRVTRYKHFRAACSLGKCPRARRRPPQPACVAAHRLAAPNTCLLSQAQACPRAAIGRCNSAGRVSVGRRPSGSDVDADGAASTIQLFAATCIGLHGAAGLLLTDPGPGVLLQTADLAVHCGPWGTA